MGIRSRYPEYFRLSKSEFDKLWEDCLFVFDTNVLLNLYRLKFSSSKELLSILRGLRDRIWLPDQACLEFSRNRSARIVEKKIALLNLVKSSDEATQSAKATLLTALDEALIENSEEIRSGIESFFQDLTEKLNKSHVSYPDLLEDDTLLTELEEILGDNIGSSFDPERLSQIYVEGKGRYDAKTPPGYGDIKEKKEEHRLYGDLVLWKQVLEKAKECQKPIILITDDAKKGDWYSEASGRIMGPRPELIKEMRDIAGVNYYQYQTEQFMKYAADHLKRTIGSETLEDIREVATNSLEDEGAVGSFPQSRQAGNLSLFARDRHAVAKFMDQCGFHIDAEASYSGVVSLVTIFLAEVFPSINPEHLIRIAHSVKSTSIRQALTTAQSLVLRHTNRYLIPDMSSEDKNEQNFIVQGAREELAISAEFPAFVPIVQRRRAYSLLCNIDPDLDVAQRTETIARILNTDGVTRITCINGTPQDATLMNVDITPQADERIVERRIGLIEGVTVDHLTTTYPFSA